MWSLHSLTNTKKITVLKKNFIEENVKFWLQKQEKSMFILGLVNTECLAM